MENKIAVQDNQSFSCKMRYCPLAFPDQLHETSRAMQSSRRPRMSCRTMCICCLTSASTATLLRSSSAGWNGPPKRPHFTPSHATKSCILSRPRLGVPLPMAHFFNSMQACNRQDRSPSAWKTSPPCKKTSPFRVQCAIIHSHFPTNCTRPPVRCKAPAGRACLFARCAYAARPREALLWSATLQAPDGKVGQCGPSSLPLMRPSRAF